MTATDKITPEASGDGSPRLHSAPLAQRDIEQAQAMADFDKLDAYGRRCALAMLSGLAKLRAGKL